MALRAAANDLLSGSDCIGSLSHALYDDVTAVCVCGLSHGPVRRARCGVTITSRRSPGPPAHLWTPSWAQQRRVISTINNISKHASRRAARRRRRLNSVA